MFNLMLKDIENDDLRRIKRVIRKIGGWPVLDGESNTHETKFDWINATYKLRELGYPFTFFFEVDVTRKLEDKERFYLKVTKPSERDPDEVMEKYPKKEATQIMANVAKAFGAENLPVDEMIKVYEFWKMLDAWIYADTPVKKYTIEEYQNKYDETNRVPFDWLEFLQKLVGPQILLASYDYVSLQDPETISGWINAISTTSQRTVGNYMIWSLIEANVPYLPNKIQNITKYSTDVSREEFCCEETSKRFLPSPILILYANDLLQVKKRQDVQEIFSNIKSEFLNLFERTIWMEEKDKQRIKNNAKTLTFINGLPEYYFSDKVFDDMVVDLVETEDDTFLDLLAQANRNRQTMFFKVITLAASTNVNSRIYLRQTYLRPVYLRAENELFVPMHMAYILQKYTLKSSRYAFIGSFLASFLGESLYYYDYEFRSSRQELSQRTMYVTRKIPECLRTQTHNYRVFEENLEAVLISAGDKASYLAYERWLENNTGEIEQVLNYTQRQLFWIVATYCYVPNVNVDTNASTAKLLSEMNLMIKLNNPYFAKDFNCSVGSKTNPVVKCPLYL